MMKRQVFILLALISYNSIALADYGQQEIPIESNVKSITFSAIQPYHFNTVNMGDFPNTVVANYCFGQGCSGNLMFPVDVRDTFTIQIPPGTTLMRISYCQFGVIKPDGTGTWQGAGCEQLFRYKKNSS